MLKRIGIDTLATGFLTLLAIVCIVLEMAFNTGCSTEQKPEPASAQDLANVKQAIEIEHCISFIVSVSNKFNEVLQTPDRSQIDESLGVVFQTELAKVKSCNTQTTRDFRMAVSVFINRVVKMLSYSAAGKNEQAFVAMKEALNWAERAQFLLNKSRSEYYSLLGL
jgi:hypothetical protein